MPTTGPDNTAENTDRELWRNDETDHSIHITAVNGIGINVDGLVYVMTLEQWHSLAQLQGLLIRHSDNIRELINVSLGR